MDGNGSIALDVLPTDDVAWEAGDGVTVLYWVEERLDHLPPRDYAITVPTEGVNLAAVAP